MLWFQTAKKEKRRSFRLSRRRGPTHGCRRPPTSHEETNRTRSNAAAETGWKLPVAAMESLPIKQCSVMAGPADGVHHVSHLQRS